MADCAEVITRKHLQALLQSALEATKLSAAVNNSQTTIPISEYPKMWPAFGTFSILIGSETMSVTAGHGTTTLTVTRAAPVSHLINAAVTITTSRVYLGTKELDVDGDFFGKLISIGPVAQIRKAVRGEQDYQGHYSYVVAVRFYYGYPKGQDYDYTAIENCNAAALKALGTASNYTGSTKGNPPESGITCEQVDEDAENEVGVSAKFEFKLPFLSAI